jgi:hypothetical protein
MEFKHGDRVRMVKHADWKNDAVGTIISVRTRPATLYDGSTDVWYSIEFDELQRDYTDEMNGKDLHYKSSTVLGRFLRPLDEAG